MFRTARRITGAAVTTVLDGRVVTVVFRSPYRWRIYEGEREVTKEFGLNGRALAHDDSLVAFHSQVKAGETACRLTAVA